MNKREFSEALAVVADYYGKALTTTAISVYYDLASHMDAKVFQELVKRHMKDSEHGMFFPTYAHLINQAANKNQLKLDAEKIFDSNPRQGISTFDFQRETTEKRDSRRLAFIRNYVSEFESLSDVEKLELAISNDYLRIESK